MRSEEHEIRVTAHIARQDAMGCLRGSSRRASFVVFQQPVYLAIDTFEATF